LVRIHPPLDTKPAVAKYVLLGISENETNCSCRSFHIGLFPSQKTRNAHLARDAGTTEEQGGQEEQKASDYNRLENLAKKKNALETLLCKC